MVFQGGSVSELTRAVQKDQILHAAEAVVHHFGFAKTTMNDIAKALRKGKSSLYHYFQSKEQIFVELLHKEIADLRGEFLRVVEAEPTPERKIRAYILTRMQLFQQKMNQHMSFMQETSERYELLMKIHEAYDPDEIRIISAILEAGVADGLFVIDDIPATSTAIVFALKGFEYPFTRIADAAEIVKKLDRTLSILFYGIVPR
jgi:AcrR family transcriptional regulator